MKLFKLIRGKHPLQHEQRGDRLFASEAWGKAKREYDIALEKLARKPTPDKTEMERLTKKIQGCREALSRQHLQTGNGLEEAGYVEEAREYYLLGLQLTEDEQLRSVLEDQLKKAEPLHAVGESTTVSQDFYYTEEMAAGEDIFADDRTYFNALCNTLPEEIRRIYRGYGEPFRSGYIALNRGDFDTAVEALFCARADHLSDDDYIALELATAYVNLEQYEAARSLLEPFLRHHPDALPAYRLLCEIFWENDDYSSAERLLSGVPQGLRESEAFILLHGETIQRQKRYPEAAAWYRASLNTYGWNENIARALAVSLDSAKQKGPARELYGEIIQRCSSCSSPPANAARIDPFVRRRYAELSMAAGDHSTNILELFLSLVRDDPGNAGIYYMYISRLYSRRGDETEARRFREFAENQDQKGKQQDTGSYSVSRD